MPLIAFHLAISNKGKIEIMSLKLCPVAQYISEYICQYNTIYIPIQYIPQYISVFFKLPILESEELFFS